MPSGHFAEHETLITSGSGSHPLSLRLGLGIQSRTAWGSNEDPAPPLLSSTEHLYVTFVVLLQFNKTVNSQQQVCHECCINWIRKERSFATSTTPWNYCTTPLILLSSWLVWPQLFFLVLYLKNMWDRTSRAAVLCWSQKFKHNEAENTSKSASDFWGQHPATFPAWMEMGCCHRQTHTALFMWTPQWSSSPVYKIHYLSPLYRTFDPQLSAQELSYTVCPQLLSI